MLLSMGFGVATGASPKQKICSQRNVCWCLAYALVRHGVPSENLLCPLHVRREYARIKLFVLFFFSVSRRKHRNKILGIFFGQSSVIFLQPACILCAFGCDQRTTRIFVWLHLVWKIRPKECHCVYYFIGIKSESALFWGFLIDSLCAFWTTSVAFL